MGTAPARLFDAVLQLLTTASRAVIRRRSHTHRSRVEGVLGTRLDVTVVTGMAADGPTAEHLLLAELDRLEQIFSVFRADSELRSWMAGGRAAPVSAELARLLRLALDWQARSGGAFNPSVGRITARWERAAALGVAPTAQELSSLAAEITEAPFHLDGEVAVPDGDCTGLNLNAIAKGMVVDLACAAVVRRIVPRQLLVNLGGDLLVHGDTELMIGVADPASDADNAPPLHVVGLSGGAMATSGSSWRGFDVAGRRWSHVIDPRTGVPVDHVLSATVIAPTVADADAAATVLGVLEPTEGTAFADRLGLAGCVVDRGGRSFTSAAWKRYAR